MKRGILFLLTLVISFSLSAQDDLTWWKELHDYPNAAGQFVSRYQNISPGFMGPNALRVPDLLNGRIDNDFWFAVAGDIHRGRGDKTSNLFLELNLALAKDRVMVYANSVPLEYFSVTPTTRDERRMINYSGEGNTSGDIQVGTVFRVFLEENSGINTTIRIHMKTTTGGSLPNARFTNHGMYAFDAQFSKTIMDKGDHSLLIKAMFGFLTWQTNKNGLENGSKFLQNDAPLYGLGFEYQYKKLRIATDFSGYNGYVGNRDYPLFSRTQVQYRLGNFGLFSEMNLGLRTWDWNTGRLGLRFFFAKAD